MKNEIFIERYFEKISRHMVNENVLRKTKKRN